MAERPPWLTRFVEVEGTIKSAPLDLPQRMDRVVAHLRAAGWVPVLRSIGTDFAGPLGFPIPQNQPLQMYLARPNNGPTEAREAQAALEAAIAHAGLGWSATNAWLREINAEVVVPTVRDAAQKAEGALKSAAPWALGALALALVALVKQK